MSKSRLILVAVAAAAGCGWLATTTGTSDTDATGSEAGEGTSVAVIRVVDGDTIDVRSGANIYRTRILGIDSPEVVDPDSPVECWGPESSAWAHQMLDGLTVTLTPDPGHDDTDRYGRALRYVALPDGTDYSILAAKRGMARAYTYGRISLEKAEEIAAAEDHARAAELGLWGTCPAAR